MRLRVVTLNFWGLSAPLERRLALAAAQLRALDPDVVCMQEVKPATAGAGASATTAHVLAAELGLRAHHEIATELPGGDSEGLAILSRAPLLETRRLLLPDPRPGDARILLSGRVQTAGGPIWVHTTHLHYKLDDGLARERQVAAVDAAIRRCGRDNDAPPQLLCGDFNATPDSDEMRFLRGLHTLEGRRTHFQDAWLRLRPEPHGSAGPDGGITWSAENPQTRPLRSLDLDRRIDYVLVTTRKKDGRGTVSRCEVVLRERDASGACASDHYAVLAEIQVVADP